MSRYKRLEDEYKLRALSHYRTERLKPYRLSKLYPNPYRKLLRPKKVSKPSYTKPQARRGRGRLPYPKPNYFQVKGPEKKYELKPKPEKMSSPPVMKTPLYTLREHGVEPWLNAEQIAEDVEKRLDSKLTERIFERFEAELAELLRKVEKTSETSAAKSTEQRLETSKQEVERNVKAMMHDGDGQEKGETPRFESIEDLSEVQEESKEDEVSLEGSFLVSGTFGLAIPTETEELEGILRESVEEMGDKEYETKPSEIEAVEKSEEEIESAEEERIDNIEETYGEVETEPAEGEVNGIESLEDIETEEPVSPENGIETTPENITENENAPELLPEETELYPVEQEPEIM